MGICSGSSVPGIEVVPNKYTINVENSGKKRNKSNNIKTK